MPARYIYYKEREACQFLPERMRAGNLMKLGNVAIHNPCCTVDELGKFGSGTEPNPAIVQRFGHLGETTFEPELDSLISLHLAFNIVCLLSVRQTMP